MSDQINLSIGEAPWQPSQESEVVLEFNHYDMPTAGVLLQSGCFFLFECLEGIVEDANVWAYAPLDLYEKEQLSALSGDDLFAAMQEIWQSRPATCALAVSDKIRTGDMIDSETIRERGILSASFRTIIKLLDQEKTASRALQDSASSS